MDLNQILADIVGEISVRADEIEAAADSKNDDVAPGPVGIAVAQRCGEVVRAGADDAFPIQSISKVFALDLALRAMKDRVFERVGREPSGDPFNSVIDLERTHGIPRNPFINAGALVIVDHLVELHGEHSRDAVVDLVRNASGNAEIELDSAVLEEGTQLNRAMLSFMRHSGNIRASDDAIIDAYLRQCAITLDVAGLANAGRLLTRTRLGGTGDSDRRAKHNRTLLALMMTCGHYDASGDFAVRVGLPAKSGVGGGILAIAPELGSIAVWSPNLDQHGNSILGVRALEMFADRTGWSVFGPHRE